MKITYTSLLKAQYINFFCVLLFLAVSPAFTIAQSNTFVIRDTLEWSSLGKSASFQGALFTSSPSPLPVYHKRFKLPSNGTLNAAWTNQELQRIEAFSNSTDIATNIEIQTQIKKDRGEFYGEITFIPLVQNHGTIRVLLDFELEINFNPQSSFSFNPRTQTYLSQLSDGKIYKIAVKKDGIYKLDYNFLSNLGIDVNNINPKHIKILGNGSGMLPAPNNAARADDLLENTIYIEGENDGSFDNNDFILFYGQAADKLIWNESNNVFDIEKNIYDESNYYFIKIGNENGARIGASPSLGNTSYVTSSFNAVQKLEEDKRNLLHDYSYTSGSGKKWFGDEFSLGQEKNYSFTFKNIITTSPVSISSTMAIRNGNVPSRFSMNANGHSFLSPTVSTVDVNNINRTYAYESTAKGTFNSNSDKINVTIQYNAPSGTAWLDYILINARRTLRYDGEPLIFRDIQTIGQNASQFQLSTSNNNIEIWDISNATTPSIQQINTTGNQITFGANTLSLRTFIAFDRTQDVMTPTAIGEIENQNLHQISSTDVLLIYHKDFITAAQTLATHRNNHSGMTVTLAEIGQIYNEFSSGKKDPLAIRDFVRMIYQRSPSNFKYLILLGDGSFDTRNIYQSETPSDFIPVYETHRSLAPIFAFPSDDFYTLLDEEEGDNMKGALDIAVGRIPVANANDANKVVQKIIHYETSPNTLGDWRNRLTYVADDEDGNIHLTDSDGIATMIDTSLHNFNINKIYFDAFQQESSSGGNTYPSVKSAINTSIYKGQLVINYLGHGGPTSWAQERVLQESDINNWKNKNKLPLFITATCSFTPYDDGERVSAGEKVFLKEDGGGIALFTTVRVVYSHSNERLTRATFKHLFKKINGEYLPIGEVLRVAKNSNSADTTTANARKFTLIGDPTMRLAIPQYNVITTHIDNQTISDTDTISALQSVDIKGFVADANEQKISDFNGVVQITVYDKAQTISTLANDVGSTVKQFSSQKNILFKGAASVTNGNFSFSFIVPKDIDYSYGKGKISYYASDGVSRDAAGATENIIIGGTAAQAIQDDTPPKVEVFMGDEQFAFGGLVNESPLLFVKLSDDYGINVAGTGLGHNLTAILDEQEQDPIILNDFYESETNNFKQGYVKYPLSNLAEGRHSIKVKGWDIANNPGEGYTEFVVANSEQAALKHLLNYPNPFTTQTEFQFEHNLPAQSLRVQIDIYTINGSLVKTIQKDVIAEGHRITGITWNGKDEYGDKLGRGVYLYKVSIGTEKEQGFSERIKSSFQKLVILK